jgi:hypothetical protein
VGKITQLTLILLLALILRLYPTISTSLPFSVDAWSPIRNTELILHYTPINLDSGILDDYNRYWPANSLFGAVFSQATGLKPILAMALGIPLAGALATLIFYTLICRVSGSRKLALFSSILIATAYPYTLFTAGVTKETYANPLYLLTILLFLSCRGWREMVLFAVASSALVMAHHLTTLITIATLAAITLAHSIVKIKRGASQDYSSLLPLLILTSAATLYFALYAHRGLKVTLTLSDLLSAASYQIIAFTIALYLAFKPKKHSNRGALISSTASAAIVFFIAFLCTKRPITPDAPTLPSHYLLYATPFILAAPLAALGLGELRSKGENNLTPLFWLSTLAGLEAYAIFGDNPLGLTLAYRALNLLCIPLITLSAYGLHRLYESCSDSRKQKAAKASAITILIAAAALNSYNLYASVTLQERYLGYFWLYRQPEYYAASWIKDVAGSETIACDVKTSYLLTSYFGLNTNALQGLQYLTGRTGTKPQILITYEQMARNGYVIYGGYSVDLPQKWMEKASQMNLIYSNKVTKIHAR